MRIHKRHSSQRFPNKSLKRAALIVLVALIVIPFACFPRSRRVLVSHTSAPLQHSESISTYSVKILIDGKYYIVPDRARMDSLGIPFVGRRVFVCTGPYSECFHLRYHCQGLQNCSKSFLVYSEDSIPKNLRPCELCARNFRYIDSRDYPDSCLIRL